MGHGDSGWDWRSFAWLNKPIPLRPVDSVARLHAAKARYSSKWGRESAPLLCKSQDALEKLGADLLIHSARDVMVRANTPIQRVYVMQNSHLEYRSEMCSHE